MIPLVLSSSTLQPVAVVTQKTSLIWNERYSSPDSFKLVTSNIDETLELLPHDSLLTLQDSRRFMIVESHEIARNSEGGYELTVSGYGFEGFYKHRAITKKHTFSREWREYDYPEGIVRKLLVENVGPDARASIQRTPIYVPAIGSVESKQVRRIVGEGDLEPVIEDILISYNLGMHSMRPPSSVPVELSPTVMIHGGRDRTEEASSDPIIFDAFKGGISDDSYINTTANFKNAIYQVRYDNFLGGSSGDNWYDRSYSSGLDVKAAFLSVNGEDWSSERATQRRELFSQKRQEIIFQGTLALPHGVEYDQDIFIGDLVTVKGAYGFQENMRFTEFSRIEDAEGERSYPTLTKDKELPDE